MTAPHETTGRSSRRSSRRPARPVEEDVLDAEEASSPRTGARRTVVYYIKQLPHYVRLLTGLLADSRVAGLDKLLVGAAVAYILLPVDWIPDFIPFLGEVDDVYVLALALQRLVANAGRTLLAEHWHGPRADLANLDLQAVLSAAAFFLPRRLRRRLRVIGRRDPLDM